MTQQRCGHCAFLSADCLLSSQQYARTALHAAAYEDHAGIVRRLTPWANVNAQDNVSRTCAFHSIPHHDVHCSLE